MWRIVRVTVLGLAWRSACSLSVTPDLVRFIPENIPRHWAEALAFFCVVAYAIARRLAVTTSEGRKSSEWARAGLKWLDVFSDWALRDGPGARMGVFCLGLLLAWVPHYLTWPSSRDQDNVRGTRSIVASRILPYRDIRGYNFPGATYIAWVLGYVFGWGNTVVLHAFDAGCVVTLGAEIMLAWSRRRLSGAVPGLIGYLAFCHAI